MKNIQLIIGSIRDSRIGSDVAQFIIDGLDDESTVEVVDLKDWQIPPVTGDMPSATSDNYQTDGANDWAAQVAKADGFVFVTPEYNASIPGQLKNSLDAIYDEWLDKPALIVGYSPSAGGAASAVSHLEDILQRLKMRLAPSVTLPSWGKDHQDQQQFRHDLDAAWTEFKNLV